MVLKGGENPGKNLGQANYFEAPVVMLSMVIMYWPEPIFVFAWLLLLLSLQLFACERQRRQRTP